MLECDSDLVVKQILGSWEEYGPKWYHGKNVTPDVSHGKNVTPDGLHGKNVTPDGCHR